MTEPERRGSLIKLAALGAAILSFTALGGPALRNFGDSGFAALAVASGVAAWAATEVGDRLGNDKSGLLVILLVAFALRALALAEPPLLSDDIYRYIWDGRVQAAGINPYRFVPADPALATLRDTTIFPFINRADYAHTIYPPVAQAFFFLVTRVSETVLGMRLALVLCEVATAGAIVGLLKVIGRPSSRIVAYLWHPLPVWEIANNGHIDSLMVALMMVGLWVALAASRPRVGAAVVALAALVKPTALLALPPLWRPWDWRMVATVGLVAAMAYSPYLTVGRGVLGFLGSGYLGEQGLDTGAGFWMLRVVRAVVGGSVPGDTLMYLVVAGAILSGLALRMGFRLRKDSETQLRDMSWLLVAFLVLLSPEYPWYELPLVGFLALFSLPVGWVMSVGMLTFYDVVQGDAQLPFYFRAGALNVAILIVLVHHWRTRSTGAAR